VGQGLAPSPAVFRELSGNMRRAPLPIALAAYILLITVFLGGQALARESSAQPEAEAGAQSSPRFSAQLGVEASADLILSSGLDDITHERAVRFVDGVAYLPLRQTSAAFGAAAYWIDDAVVMRLLTERDSIELTVGEASIRAGGQVKALDAPPMNIDGEMHISLQSAMDLLGIDGVWSEDQRSLVLRKSLPLLAGMAMEKLPDGRLAVVLTFSQPIYARLTGSFLTSPDRFFVDIPGVRIGLKEDQRILEVDDPILLRVRASQNLPDPPTVRVVLDLDRAFRYSVSRDPKDFTRVIIAPAFKIESAELVRTPDGGYVRILSDGGPVSYQINYYLEPDRIVIDLANSFLLPGALEVSNDDHYFVKSIRASQNQPDMVRVVIDLRRPYPFTPYVPDGSPNELRIAFGKMVYAPEIIDTPASVLIRVRSSQPNSGSVWADSIEAERHRLVIDFENSFFGFDPADVKIDSELISGFRAGRFQAHVVRMVFDLTRFCAYSMPRAEDGDGNVIVIQLYKTLETAVFGRKIVIDPGHGSLRSVDPDGGPGAVRTLDGETVMEKDLNLSVALKLRDLLKAAGANVLLTRETDVGVTLRDRWVASDTHQAEIFVSLHHNATPAEWSDKRGVEVFHKPGDEVSQTLAKAISAELSKATSQNSNYVGVHPGMRLAVVENVKAPAVLVEVAYMSCLEDLKRIVTEEFQNSAAEGIYNGLVRFFLARYQPELGAAGADASAVQGAGGGSAR
jgi:N-acetylmuramoyl-L-alanine amidase